MGSYLNRACIIPSLGVLLLIPLRAESAPPVFAPVNCSGAGWPNQPVWVDWDFNTGWANNFQTYTPTVAHTDYEVPGQWTYMGRTAIVGGNYSNNIARDTSLAANQFVKVLTFQVNVFQTEAGHDGLTFGSGSAQCVPGNGARPLYPYTQFFPTMWNDQGQQVDNPMPFFISGDIPPLAHPLQFDACTPNGKSLQTNPLRMYFNSDGANPDKGIQIPGVYLTCSAPGVAGEAPLTPAVKASGIMLAQNDTVYFTMPGPTDASDATTVMVWPNAPWNNTDEYGVFVTCNQPVTPAAAPQWSDFSLTPGPQALVRIPQGICANGTFHIAVNDLSNRTRNPTFFNLEPTSFNIMAGYHAAGWDFTQTTSMRPLTVGTDFVPTNPEDTQIKEFLRQTANAWFGVTEGSVYVQTWNYYNKGKTLGDGRCACLIAGADNAGPCEVCISKCTAPGLGQHRSHSTLNYAVACDTDAWQTYGGGLHRGVYTLIHEMSHAFFGWYYSSFLWWSWPTHPMFADEYTATNLGLHNEIDYNQCEHTIMGPSYRFDLNAYCTEFDHGKDGDSPTAVTDNCDPFQDGPCVANWQTLRNGTFANPQVYGQLWSPSPNRKYYTPLNAELSTINTHGHLGNVQVMP